MKTIAIVAQKGGVGKSVTALNLAACFALNGTKTLLIDLDKQSAGLTNLLSENPSKPPQNTILDVLMGKQNVDSATINVLSANLQFLPCSPFYDDSKVINLQDLKKAISKTSADIVVLDTPPALGRITLSAMTAADGIVAPTTETKEGYYSFLDTYRIFAEVYQKLNRNLKLYGIIPAFYEKRTNVSRQYHDVLQKLANDCDCQLFTGVPRCAAMQQALSLGESIFNYAPKSTAAAAYEAIANELKGLM